MKRLTAFCASILATVTVAFAQNPDSLAFVTADWQISEPDKGVESRTASMKIFDSKQTVSIIRYKQRRFYTRIVQTAELTPTSTTARDRKAVAAINAGYWNVEKVVPSTYVRIDGHDCSHTEDAEAYRVNGILTIDGRDIEVFACDTSQYGKYTPMYDNILASGPILVDDGKPFAYDPSLGSFFGRNPRSFIGRTEKGDVFMVVVDGRFEQAEGMTINELVEVCRWLGLVDAINLDGGGSSTLWSSDRGVLNHPYDNKRFDHEGERAVSSCLVVLPPR